MSDKDSFKEWAKVAELNGDTVTLFTDNGFSSMKSVKLLNSAIIQKNLSKTVTRSVITIATGC